MSIKEAAKALTDMLIANGQFATIPAKGSPAQAFRSEEDPDELDPIEEYELDKFSVNAVGYEEGVDDPKLYLFTAKGQKKSIQKTVTINNQTYHLETCKIGKIGIDLSQTFKTNQLGEIFLRHGTNVVCCGSSCAPARENHAGTFGALVRLNGSMYVLSNNHVIASCNHVEPGISILSPANGDSRPGFPPLEIARLEFIQVIQSGHPVFIAPNSIDLALAKVMDESKVSSWQGDSINGFDTPATVVRPFTGLKVKKFGRTTGYTEGTLHSVMLRIAIPYEAPLFSGLVFFDDVWVVIPDGVSHFSLPGDSGSIVVAADDSGVVGLNFAGNPGSGLGFMIPFDRVVSAFPGLTLVSGHQV